MHPNFKYYLLIILFPINLYSQTEVLLNDLNELHDIATYTYYLEDASLTLSIDNVISEAYQEDFQANAQDNINFSSTASAYWLKFKITKQEEGNFYLNVGSAYIDAISLYEFSNTNTLISTRHTGDDLPFENREIKVSNFLFALDFDKNTTHTFYLRVKSDQPLFFPLRVGTLQNFIAYEHDLDFLQGIYFGVMLLIFLYNLFLFFSTKEKIYLYYIAYVFSITWFMASVFGYFFEYFWPNTPFINQLVVVSSGLTMITATFFTQQFLNTKSASPKMHKLSQIFIALGVLVCALTIIGFKIQGLMIAQAGLLVMALYFITLGIRFWLKGYRPAKYYLLAWGFLVVGIFFAILESLNLTPVMTYLNAMQIGSALEVGLLSFALGDRINLYKKQKVDAQIEALKAAKEKEQLIQEQNIILEKKVKERTTIVANQNEELVNLNKEKDMLVNMVAHDLKTPLHQIQGLVGLLELDAMQIDDEEKNYLEEIDNSANRLAEMIDRILDVSAIDIYKVKLKPEVIDFVELVESVAQTFHLTAKQKNIDIQVKAQEGSHFVETDRGYTLQVLENLLSNAIKFSEKGKHIILHVKSQNGRTAVIVEDHGPGISQEDQKKLFGRFQKLSARPTAGESSTGLGLSIVKKYVDAMKGDIICESELGVGTKFIISFDSKELLAKKIVD